MKYGQYDTSIKLPGSEYYGEVAYSLKKKRNVMHGYGRLEFSDGKVIEGYFKQNYVHGHAIVTYANGESFEGDFDNGARTGLGKEFYPNKNIKFLGNFKNGLKFGHGSEYYENGNLKFDGEFIGNIKGSKGSEYYENGNLKFDGNFYLNKKNGFGKEYDENGHLLFEGKYSVDSRSGRGTLYLKNGCKIIGDWGANGIQQMRIKILIPTQCPNRSGYDTYEGNFDAKYLFADTIMINKADNHYEIIKNTDLVNSPLFKNIINDPNFQEITRGTPYDILPSEKTTKDLNNNSKTSLESRLKPNNNGPKIHENFKPITEEDIKDKGQPTINKKQPTSTDKIQPTSTDKVQPTNTDSNNGTKNKIDSDAKNTPKKHSDDEIKPENKQSVENRPTPATYSDILDIKNEQWKDFGKNIYGQDEVIKTIKLNLASKLYPFTNSSTEHKPFASYLFTGPTGVGKSQIAKNLASAFNVPLFTIDFTTFQNSCDVARLIGSTVGYVGSDTTPEFIKFLKENKASVLLFDELDKAHPSVLHILMSMLDEAVVADAKQNIYSLKDTIIICTTNETADTEKLKGSVEERLTKGGKFKKEHLARFNKVLEFKKISREAGKKIAYQLINECINNFKENRADLNVKIYFTNNLINDILDKAQFDLLGTREINKTIIKFFEEFSWKYLEEQKIRNKCFVLNGLEYVHVCDNKDDWTKLVESRKNDSENEVEADKQKKTNDSQNTDKNKPNNNGGQSPKDEIWKNIRLFQPESER